MFLVPYTCLNITNNIHFCKPNCKPNCKPKVKKNEKEHVSLCMRK